MSAVASFSSLAASPLFLRRVLWLDAATGVATGALQLLLSGLLASLLGLPETLLVATGWALFGYVVLISFIATRQFVPEGLVWLLIIANLLDSASAGDATRIFIGAENKLFALSGSSVIARPFRGAGGRVPGRRPPGRPGARGGGGGAGGGAPPPPPPPRLYSISHTAFNALSTSSARSSACSSPTDRRTSPSSMPCFARCSTVRR